MARYDIAIIGTGPAGLSAAVTATIRNKSVLLLGSKDLSPKVQKAHKIQNYLGIPDAGGEELGEAFRRHIDQLGIEIHEEKVTNVYAMGDYFALQTDKTGVEKMHEASSVILATGVVQAKELENEGKFLGRGVSYCATCDAMLYKGKNVAVIGGGPDEEKEAEFLAEVCSNVDYYPLYKQETRLSDRVHVIREFPTGIDGQMKADKLITLKGERDYDGIFVLRAAIAPDKLVPGLETENGHVKVNLRMETSIAGLFAAGDCAGRPYQYIKSAGQGNVAALSAVDYLAAK